MKLAQAKELAEALAAAIAQAEALGLDEIDELPAALALDDAARDELAKAIARAGGGDSGGGQAP